MTAIALAPEEQRSVADPDEGQGAAPIFIVGVSRSGTTLIRRILNRSDQIAICAENHFMGHLLSWEGTRYKFRQLGDLADDDNVRKLVDFIYTGGLERSWRYRQMSSHWYWLIKRVDPNVLRERILASDRSERALFMIMMTLYAEQKGKPLMGEKTPAHVRYVDTLLAWYPEAKVIHMVRDPRAIYVSELRRRQVDKESTLYQYLKRVSPLFKLFVFMQTALAWWESVARYRRYRRSFVKNYYPLKFERLVQEPEQTIRDLCCFLGVEFQESMLDQEVVSLGFSAGQQGFDARTAQRWKAQIDPWVDRAYSFLFKSYVSEFGYLD